MIGIVSIIGFSDDGSGGVVGSQKIFQKHKECRKNSLQ